MSSSGGDHRDHLRQSTVSALKAGRGLTTPDYSMGYSSSLELKSAARVYLLGVLHWQLSSTPASSSLLFSHWTLIHWAPARSWRKREGTVDDYAWHSRGCWRQLDRLWLPLSYSVIYTPALGTNVHPNFLSIELSAWIVFA